MNKPIISKSDFRLFLHAPRHLWAKKNGKLAKTADPFWEYIFDQAYTVEKLAEKYFLENIVPKLCIAGDDIEFQLTHTSGSFQARADILVKNPQSGKWDLYEVKAAPNVKPAHRMDATFQTLVFEDRCPIGEIYILHLQKNYVREKKMKLEKFFTITNITENVGKLRGKVKKLRQEALHVFSVDDPQTLPECIQPKKCPCIDVCHPDLPDYSIYDIVRITGNEKRVRELLKRSGKSIFDVPKDFDLSEGQRLHVDSVQNDEVYIKLDEIRSDLEGLQFPLHFIDYECANPAIPLFPGYKPFDFMPFQYSLHVLDDPGGALKHYEHIETESVDPIPGLISSLQDDLRNQGSIIVWNKAFEGKVNLRMGEIHPGYKNFCADMNSRMYDLMDIFQKLWYVDPRFKGSHSLKNVLPVLVPDMNYDDMEIAKGSVAMAEWEHMVHDDSRSKKEKSTIRKNLLKYCEMDTLATVKIYEKLRDLIHAGLDG